MFQSLSQMPPDPILGLNQTFQEDSNPDKINLGIGVYQDAKGHTPIFTAVKKAESQMLAAQQSKSYIAQAGDPSFLSGSIELLLGSDLTSELGERVSAVMTPGGCGALRMLAELLVNAPESRPVWVSDPTWANHYPLLQSAGLELHTYAYYDPEVRRVNFEKMLESVMAIPEGDTILLHACCHNPTGADITQQQWDQLIDLLEQRQILPFFDIAYQGFGDGLDADAYGIREAAKRLPEVIIASSCSKNFGLYRERTGAAIVISAESKTAIAAKSHIMAAARRSYSMSPYHGGGIVGTILADAPLRQEWETELEQVRGRMNTLRIKLAEGLNDAQSNINFDFLADSKGMFCYLGIPKEVVLELRSEYGIYLLESTRINIAGLSEANLPIIVDRVATLLSR